MNFEEYFYYDETSPTCLRWKIDVYTGKNKSRKLVGMRDVAGYLGKGEENRSLVGLKGKHYKCHRVVWNLFFGEIPKNLVVDHINRNHLDNRINNLRLVDQSINAKNRPKVSNNTSGSTGVNFWVWERCGYRYEYWVACWLEQGKQKQKKFSVLKLGNDLAKTKAEDYRKNIMKTLQITEGYTESHGE